MKFLIKKSFLFFIFFLSSSINSYATDYYWVGGTGNWSDYSNHWATSSGGVIFQTTTPGPFDNVFFDLNSFQILNDTVNLDVSIGYCKDMDWTGALNDPIFRKVLVTNRLRIYGSITLVPIMDFSVIGVYFYSALPGNTITSAGHTIGMSFMGTGAWTLLDPILNGYFDFSNGNLNTNDQPINCSSFYCFPSAAGPVNIQLGTSVINVFNVWETTSHTMNISGSSSMITCPEFKTDTNQFYGEVITNMAVVNNSSINKLIAVYSFPTNGNVEAADSKINTIIFNGPGRCSTFGSLVQKIIFTDDAIIFKCSVDTLIFTKPGCVINQGSGILYINNVLWTNAYAGFPVSWQAGAIATISSPINITICLDYIYFQNMQTTGGATFYAGDHSVDLGGNSGWLWTSCTPDTSNIWPGDANYDLVADNIDILYIGLAYGYTGPVRIGATTNWVAQPGIDWLQQFATGYNIKHADCDGNGTVNAVDTNAVSLNYGLVHPFKNPTPPLVNNFGTDLYFDIPPTSLTPGADVDIPIMFGTNTNAAQNVYGIAFTVNYDPAFIQANTAEITFNNSWFGNAGNTIHLSKDFYNSGFVDMALVKTDHQNETGNGQLATLHFKVASNASGYLNLSFSKVLVLDKSEIQQPVNVLNGSIFTGIKTINDESGITVYPNPASQKLFIDDPQHAILNARITDMNGKCMADASKISAGFSADITHIRNGCYIVEIISGKVISRKKLVILH